MAMAMLLPEPEKGGRGKKATTSGEFTNVPQQRLSDARAVLVFSQVDLQEATAGLAAALPGDQLAASAYMAA